MVVIILTGTRIHEREIKIQSSITEISKRVVPSRDVSLGKEQMKFREDSEEELIIYLIQIQKNTHNILAIYKRRTKYNEIQ